MNNCRNTAVAFLLVAGIGFAANAAQGAAVVYEPFAFGQGDTLLNGNAGGTGLTGSWVAPDGGAVESTNLTYGALPTSGSATVAKGWNSGSPRIGIAPGTLNGLLDDGGELWMSFLYKYGADINHRFGIGIGDSHITMNGDLFDEDSNASTDEQGIGFAEVWNSGRPAIPTIWDTNDYDGGNMNGAPTLTTTTAPGLVGTSQIGFTATADETYLIVLHAQWGADGATNDTVTLYTPGTDLTLGSAVATYQAIVSQDSFDTLFFTADQTIGDLDEIRIGATYNDVVPVPEPASLALIGLGGLMMIRRRRN
jgi:hypothetical protein